MASTRLMSIGSLPTRYRSSSSYVSATGPRARERSRVSVDCSKTGRTVLAIPATSARTSFGLRFGIAADLDEPTSVRHVVGDPSNSAFMQERPDRILGQLIVSGTTSERRFES
jgi:hypothetical protein